MQILANTVNPTRTNAAAPRLDLYRPIHQTLRAAMAQTLVGLGALDLSDAPECAQVLGAADRLLTILDSHLHHEEVFMHPALNAAEPGVVADTEAEHAAHRADIAALRAEMAALAAAPRDDRGAALYRHFALFMAENHEHMHFEETRLNAVLWAAYSDAELASIHDRIVASLPPEELAATLPLMLPALSPEQRAGMLGAMQTQMPPEAMRSVLALAESALDRTGWAKLKAALLP